MMVMMVKEQSNSADDRRTNGDIAAGTCLRRGRAYNTARQTGQQRAQNRNF